MGSGRLLYAPALQLIDSVNPAVIDLLGHDRTGGSEDPGRFNAEEQVQDLTLILDRLELSPLWLHGYSMGGRLALQLAAAEPRLFEGLILESSGFGITELPQRDERQKADEKRACRIETDFTGFLDDWQQLPLFSAPSDTEITERHKDYRSVMSAQKPAWMAASLRGFGAGIMPPLEKHLSSIDLPVLLLSGEFDQKYRSIHQRMSSLLPNAHTKIVKEAAHRIHLDRPESWAESIQTFIRNPKKS